MLLFELKQTEGSRVDDGKRSLLIHSQKERAVILAAPFLCAFCLTHIDASRSGVSNSNTQWAKIKNLNKVAGQR